jgi:hypothetical protein
LQTDSISDCIDRVRARDAAAHSVGVSNHCVPVPKAAVGV